MGLKHHYALLCNDFERKKKHKQQLKYPVTHFEVKKVPFQTLFENKCFWDHSTPILERFPKHIKTNIEFLPTLFKEKCLSDLLMTNSLNSQILNQKKKNI